MRAPGDVAVQPQRVNLGQLMLLAGCMFVAMFTLTLPVAQLEEFVDRLLPAGGQDVALENTAKGLFQTAHFLAYIPFAFIWGALSDRSGKRKHILLIGLVGQGVMFSIIPLVGDLWLLYVARFVEGMFSIATVSMLMTMVLDSSPAKRRGMALGVFSLFMLLGNAAGAPLGGRLAEINYAYPFWLGAMLLAIMAGVVLLFVRESTGVTPAYSFSKAMRVLKDNPRLYIPYAFSLLDRLTVGFFIGPFTILVHEVYGLTPAQRGIYLAVFLVCFALFSPLGGMLSDRVGRARPMLLGTVLYGLMIALVGRVSPDMLYVVMAVGGLSGAVLYPPSIALVGDYTGPVQRGVAMGGFNLAGSIGFAVGPVLFSLVADAYGLLASPLVAGALCLLAAAVAAPFIWRRDRLERAPGELQGVAGET
jgi:DHA1 family tetracycline resistance protein-like MFS transporter